MYLGQVYILDYAMFVRNIAVITKLRDCGVKEYTNKYPNKKICYVLNLLFDQNNALDKDNYDYEGILRLIKLLIRKNVNTNVTIYDTTLIEHVCYKY